MFSLSRNFLKFAAASAFVALPVSGTPTCADENPRYTSSASAAPRYSSSASAAELSKFCKATAATVGLSAKDRFMAWCEAEARQVSGVPTEPPGPGMGRAFGQN